MENKDLSTLRKHYSNLIGTFVEERVGFPLNSEDLAPFQDFVHWFSLTSNSSQIKYLKSKTQEKPQFSNPFANLINTMAVDTKKGFSASVYHFQNMRRISDKLIKDIYADPIITNALHEMFPPGQDGLVAPHNPAILDFEFQAYLVSVRRTLEYLTKALNAYFLQDENHIKNLRKSLLDANPKLVSKLLVDVVDQRSDLIYGFLSKGGKITDRDWVVHHGYMQFGCLNIKKDGARFYGKNFPSQTDTDSLATIEKDLNNLRILIREFVAALIKGDQELSKL